MTLPCVILYDMMVPCLFLYLKYKFLVIERMLLFFGYCSAAVIGKLAPTTYVVELTIILGIDFDDSSLYLSTV
jgi:hypothetical protein